MSFQTGQKVQIIGSTGFVGSNLTSQIKNSKGVNRSNIDTLGNEYFEVTICAAAPAEKWKANLDPISDRENLSVLLSKIEKTKTKELVLISTIDVFPNGSNADEKSIPELPDTNYGKNRLWFEKKIADLFDGVTIIRLPGLFGSGLKKNILYDAVHDNFSKSVNGLSEFQWYDIKDLSKHINISLENDLKTVHLATEPIQTRKLFETLFPHQVKWIEDDFSSVTLYDFRTLYSKFLSGEDAEYLYGKTIVLEKISEWIKSF